MILTHTRQSQNYKDLQTDDNSTNFKLKIIITLILVRLSLRLAMVHILNFPRDDFDIRD